MPTGSLVDDPSGSTDARAGLASVPRSSSPPRNRSLEQFADRNERKRSTTGAQLSVSSVASGVGVGGNAITTGDYVESPSSQPTNRSEQSGQHRLVAVRDHPDDNTSSGAVGTMSAAFSAIARSMVTSIGLQLAHGEVLGIEVRDPSVRSSQLPRCTPASSNASACDRMGVGATS